MKRVIWLVILGILGYLAYTYYVRTTSGEVAQVHHLEKEWQRGTDRFISAMRGAGEPGLVVLADPEAAINMLKDTRVRLQELMTKLTEEKAIARAKDLEDRIRTFFKRHEIE